MSPTRAVRPGSRRSSKFRNLMSVAFRATLNNRHPAYLSIGASTPYSIYSTAAKENKIIKICLKKAGTFGDAQLTHICCNTHLDGSNELFPWHRSKRCKGNSDHLYFIRVAVNFRCYDLTWELNGPGCLYSSLVFLTRSLHRTITVFNFQSIPLNGHGTP